jgi:protein-S-isoprenylcysteine O-methyltransferase Ste14
LYRRAGQVLFRWRSYTPVPLVLIAFLGSNATIHRVIIGSLIISVGETIRIWSGGYLGGSLRTRKIGGEVLVKSGPYSYTRNPLYLGNLLLSVGMAICFWALMPYLMVILLLFFFFQYYSIVKAEEEFLATKFGEEYVLYRNSVPAFLPRLRRTEGNDGDFNFSRALKSERATFQNIGALYLLLGVRCFVLDSKLPLF